MLHTRRAHALDLDRLIRLHLFLCQLKDQALAIFRLLSASALLHLGKFSLLIFSLVLKHPVTIFFHLRFLLTHLRLLLVQVTQRLVLLQHLAHESEIVRLLRGGDRADPIHFIKRDVDGTRVLLQAPLSRQRMLRSLLF